MNKALKKKTNTKAGSTARGDSVAGNATNASDNSATNSSSSLLFKIVAVLVAILGIALGLSKASFSSSSPVQSSLEYIDGIAEYSDGATQPFNSQVPRIAQNIARSSSSITSFSTSWRVPVRILLRNADQNKCLAYVNQVADHLKGIKSCLHILTPDEKSDRVQFQNAVNPSPPSSGCTHRIVVDSNVKSTSPIISNHGWKTLFEQGEDGVGSAPSDSEYLAFFGCLAPGDCIVERGESDPNCPSPAMHARAAQLMQKIDL